MTKEEAMKLKPGDYVLLKSLEKIKANPAVYFDSYGLQITEMEGSFGVTFFYQRFAALETVCRVIECGGKESETDNRPRMDGLIRIEILDKNYKEDPDDGRSTRKCWVHWLMMDSDVPDFERNSKEVEDYFAHCFGG